MDPASRPVPLQPQPAALGRLATVCAALGDPARLRLLGQLRAGERCVTDLAGHESLSTVSQRLSLLRDAGLVQRRRVGKFAYYSIAARWVEHWLEAAFTQLAAIDASQPDEGTEGARPATACAGLPRCTARQAAAATCLDVADVLARTPDTS